MTPSGRMNSSRQAASGSPASSAAASLASSPGRASASVGMGVSSSRSGAYFGPHRVDLREEGEVEGAAQEGDAGAAAGSGLEPDGALHGAHVPESPELDGVLEVNEVLAGGVLGPVGRGVLIDRLVDGDELGRRHPRL